MPNIAFDVLTEYEWYIWRREMILAIGWRTWGEKKELKHEIDLQLKTERFLTFPWNMVAEPGVKNFLIIQPKDSPSFSSKLKLSS